jgi:hypothetical protein
VLNVAIWLLLLPATFPARAVPPLVSGDVPTADKDHLEWFVGVRYQDTGRIERHVPFTEVVYGLTERQELTFEIPYVSGAGHHGFGDAVLGTKLLLLRETAHRPGVAASFEWKLDNGNFERGLGSGAMEYDLRLRAQQTWAWFTGLANVGYTFVGEPELRGVRQERRDVVFAALAQEYALGPNTKALSELYWRTSDEPGDPDRLAANVGFKHKLRPNLTVHAAVGKSLRDGNTGGPALRVYIGLKCEFGPWFRRNRS